MQTKLLRCLQNGEIRPVGASDPQGVNVRVIASTNQDLEARLRARTFREDLYYRLNVLVLTLPPLRERVEDIPLLARVFLARSCEELGLAAKEASPEVLQWLAARPWPGNVRELENFVRRLAVFATGERVDMALVRTVLDGNVQAGADWWAQLRRSARRSPTRSEGRGGAHYPRLRPLLLARTQGNVSEAPLSGLSRAALQRFSPCTGERGQ